MLYPADLDALHGALLRLPKFADLRRDALLPMWVKGVAHMHVRIDGRGLVLRVPRLSQFDLTPAENIEYQRACFARASRSHQAPRLCAAIAPQPDIPMGALVVEEIVGRNAQLPGDLPAIADCLAAIHGLPVPPPAGRPPLLDQADPFGATLQVVLRQAEYLQKVSVAPSALDQIAAEMAWAREFAADIAGGRAPGPQPATLTVSDAHPGNYLVDSRGRAIIVDLEKALYGSPAIDLAHATLYTSTTWDRDCQTTLDAAETRAFYRHYLERAGPLGEALRPWLAPMRRITWLRTLTWGVRWLVRSGSDGDSSSDWSRANLAPDLAAHYAARVADWISPATIGRVRAEWLGEGLPAAWP